jgi:hypothetical protein
MQMKIISKLKHDKVTFGLAALLAIVVGVLGYIFISIQGPAIRLGP